MRRICPLTVIAATLVLTGCAQLSASGPGRFAIDHGASDQVEVGHREIVTDYVLVDISQKVLGSVGPIGPGVLHRSFGTGRGGAPEIRLGVGDGVQITIFEAAGGGLFSSGAPGSRPGGATGLPGQSVDNKGFISVPYAGRIKASGRTLDQVQRDVETRLASRAIEPQVIVSVADQSSADVAVFGDASSNFRARIRASGERMLDVVAKAGLRYPGHEVFITLHRGNRRGTVHFPVLLDRPEENIFVQPGDVIYINRQVQKFSVFGPTGSTGQTTGLTGGFAFEAPVLYLSEAVAKAGGLLDTRANAGHVYLYRLESRESLEHLGVKLKNFSPDMAIIPTIYRANFRDPSVFFTAGQFPMRDRDIIYVANADSVELDKFFGFVRLITGSIGGIASDIATTRAPGR